MAYGHDDNHDDFTLEEIKRIVKEVARLKIFSVAVFGGEPFIRSDIFDILNEISSYPINLTINTNGTLIDEKIAEKLAPYRAGFTISLDGSRPSVVEKIRGKGVFEKTLRAIELLTKLKKPVLISTTVMGFNYLDIPAIAELGKELGVNGVRFNHLFYINNAECYMDSLAISANQAVDIVSMLEDLEGRYGGFISGSFLQAMQFIKEIKEGRKPEVFEPSERLAITPCGAGKTKCAIKPNGEVIPCELLWNTPAGNLRENSLAEIWRESPVMNQFRETFYLTEKEIGNCIRCEYRFICYTGHRCNPYYGPGGIVNKRLFCMKPDMLDTEYGGTAS
ncbi:MAG: radical SAM protein [Desulfobacterales bacterium]|nr:radical SAM protein [Desulfobacterales bacterium]